VVVNEFSNWLGCEEPALVASEGRFVTLNAIDVARDQAGLFDALGGPANDDLWHYIPLPPPENTDGLGALLTMMIQSPKSAWRPIVFRRSGTDKILGMASYMRIRPEHGSAEVGCVMFSKKMQKTPAATEAMYLMARYLFEDLGYRRYEWKCNNENAASKRAAERFGFTFEGIFRNDMVMKGETRDTAWYSMIDTEWPEAKQAFETWLSPENFDQSGRQRQSLCTIRGL